MRATSHRPIQRRAACVSVATLLTVVWLPGASAQVPQAPRAPLTDVERAAHLLNRATYGARPEDVAEVLRVGIATWVDRQIIPGYGLTILEMLAEAPQATTSAPAAAGTANRTSGTPEQLVATLNMEMSRLREAQV